MARWLRLRLTSVSGFPRAWRNIRQPCSVSTPRSSNRTCGFPASGSRAGFTEEHTRMFGSHPLRPPVQSLPELLASNGTLLGRSQSLCRCSFGRHAQTEAPLLHRRYPALSLLRASPPPHTAEPAPRGVLVAGHAPALPGLPVFRVVSLADMPSPVPRWDRRAFIAQSSPSGRRHSTPRRRPSPFLKRLGSRITGFEACSAFTHVTACRLANSPREPFLEVLQSNSLPP